MFLFLNLRLLPRNASPALRTCGTSKIGKAARLKSESCVTCFYEHIIRNETELNKIRDYIRRNPLMWEGDRYNPEWTFLVIDEEGRAVPWDES